MSASLPCWGCFLLLRLCLILPRLSLFLPAPPSSSSLPLPPLPPPPLPIAIVISSSGPHIAFSCHDSFVTFDLEQLLRLLVFCDVDLKKKYRPVNMHHVLLWSLSDVSSLLHEGNAFLPRIPQKWCVFSQYITPRGTWHLFVLFWETLILVTWLEWRQTRFLHCEIISSLELVRNLSGELTNLLNEIKLAFWKIHFIVLIFFYLLLPGEKIISEP